MTAPAEHDPDEVRDLTDEEYDRTYQDGTAGHQLPPEVLAQLSGHDDPEAVPQ